MLSHERLRPNSALLRQIERTTVKLGDATQSTVHATSQLGALVERAVEMELDINALRGETEDTPLRIRALVAELDAVGDALDDVGDERDALVQNSTPSTTNAKSSFNNAMQHGARRRAAPGHSEVGTEGRA